MNKNNLEAISRIVFDLLLFVSVFLAPWWITCLIAVLILARFSAYEVVFAGILMDALGGAPTEKMYGIEFVFTIIMVVMVVLFILVKPRLIAYRS